MSKLTVSAQVTTASPEARFIAATDVGFTENVVVSPYIAVASHGIIKGVIDGLIPGTVYNVAVQAPNGSIDDNKTGQFKTPPSAAHSMSFGFASCAATGSAATVFDVIRGKAEAGELDFFIHTGDVHYEDIGVNDAALFRSAMAQAINSATQGPFFRSMPVYYMWDDHDFGPNDSDKTSAGRAAAVEWYRNDVPSPTLAATGADDGCYWSFVRSRVRFITTDCRSERTPKTAYTSSDPAHEMLSQAQLTWFKNEVLAAKALGQAIVWVNTIPWVGAAVDGYDAWWGYNYQRQEIADFLTAEGVTDRLIMLTGDMHALAYDDGTSVNNAGGLRVLQAAPLDRTGSDKGGPYLQGPIHSAASGNLNQYGVVDITDAGGDTVNVRFRGLSVSGTTETVQIDQTFNLVTSAVAGADGYLTLGASTTAYTMSATQAYAPTNDILTLACRFRTTDTDGCLAILNKASSRASYLAFRVTAGVIDVDWRDHGDSAATRLKLNTATNIADGAWHEIVGVANEDGMLKAYIDGVQVASGAFPTDTTDFTSIEVIGVGARTRVMNAGTTGEAMDADEYMAADYDHVYAEINGVKFAEYLFGQGAGTSVTADIGPNLAFDGTNYTWS